jgi:hypothetical protein
MTIVPIRELGNGGEAREGIRRIIPALSFTWVQVGDHYSLVNNSLSSRFVGLFLAHSIPEPRIHTLFYLIQFWALILTRNPALPRSLGTPTARYFTTHIPQRTPVSRHFRLHFLTVNHTNGIPLNYPFTRTLLLGQRRHA